MLDELSAALHEPATELELLRIAAGPQYKLRQIRIVFTPWKVR